MANFVIKKDGTKELFDGEKTRKSIEVAALSTSLSSDRTSEVLDKVLTAAFGLAAQKEEITTAELGKCVFEELNKIEPKTAEIWKKYEEAKLRAADHPFVGRGNNFS